MTNDEIVERLCRMFGCEQHELLNKATDAHIMDKCFCDKPEDRLYHHSDRTWWKRTTGGKLVRADPPEGMNHVASDGESQR